MVKKLLLSLTIISSLYFSADEIIVKGKTVESNQSMVVTRHFLATEVGNAILASGGNAVDIIAGGTGNDVITGGAGNDNLTGSAGNDTFNVDSGTDAVADLGGAGSGGESYVLVVSSGATANATGIKSFTATSSPRNDGTANLTSGSGGSTINVSA